VAAAFQTLLTLTLVTHCIGLAQSALIWFESMDWLSSLLSLNFIVMGVNFIMICTGRFQPEGKFCSGSIQGLESPDLYAKLSQRGAYLQGYLIAIVIATIVFLAYF
jgi:predicted nucleic acid-binding Zn ribbon protein